MREAGLRLGGGVRRGRLCGGSGADGRPAGSALLRVRELDGCPAGRPALRRFFVAVAAAVADAPWAAGGVRRGSCVVGAARFRWSLRLTGRAACRCSVGCCCPTVRLDGRLRRVVCVVACLRELQRGYV